MQAWRSYQGRPVGESLFSLWDQLMLGHSAKHFDRDPETNEVLWFAAPPLNIARKPAPRYSLEYLHWLATKRKGMDDDDEGEGVKRARISVKGTATETIEKLLL
jgi:chromatin structure-remodeling complex subunit RSC1/2